MNRARYQKRSSPRGFTRPEIGHDSLEKHSSAPSSAEVLPAWASSASFARNFYGLFAEVSLEICPNARTKTDEEERLMVGKGSQGVIV